MTNLDNIKNETIIICEQNTKNKILKQLTKEKKTIKHKTANKKRTNKKTILHIRWKRNPILNRKI